MRNLFKNSAFTFFLGAVVFGTIGVSAASLIYSKDVSYDNTLSGLKSTTVQGTLDELYEKAKNAPSCDSDGECVVTCKAGEKFETTSTGYKCSEINVGKTLVKNVGTVTSGDGLYKDSVTEERYFYRGESPKNYITFNGEMWRIISIESDGTLKIIRNQQLPKTKEWSKSNTCDETAYALPKSKKKYNKKTKSYEYISERIDYLASQDYYFGEGCSKWETPVALNKYLNDEYYNSFSSDLQKNIVSGTFNISSAGNASDTESLEIDARQEKEKQWNGKIALYTITELLRASTNSNCKSLSSGYCSSNNWLWPTFNIYYYEWLLSPVDDKKVWRIWSSGGIDANAGGPNSYGIRPVLHLSSNITINGAGTLSDPYRVAP